MLQVKKNKDKQMMNENLEQCGKLQHQIIMNNFPPEACKVEYLVLPALCTSWFRLICSPVELSVGLI